MTNIGRIIPLNSVDWLRLSCFPPQLNNSVVDKNRFEQDLRNLFQTIFVKKVISTKKKMFITRFNCVVVYIVQMYSSLGQYKGVHSFSSFTKKILLNGKSDIRIVEIRRIFFIRRISVGYLADIRRISPSGYWVFCSKL